VKTVRVQNAIRVVVRKQDGQPIKEKQPAPIVSANFYAPNVDLGAIPPRFIHQLGRSRWVIDAQAFQTITTDCHLKQPSVHRSRALAVLTMVRVLAYTLTMVSSSSAKCAAMRAPPRPVFARWRGSPATRFSGRCPLAAPHPAPAAGALPP
jgi:hypothetical protein